MSNKTAQAERAVMIDGAANASPAIEYRVAT
jgi:hypothetical protein